VEGHRRQRTRGSKEKDKKGRRETGDTKLIPPVFKFRRKHVVPDSHFFRNVRNFYRIFSPIFDDGLYF
jgi:hypothetical protein